MSQPEAQPQMPVRTAVQRCRNRLIAEYNIEFVTERDTQWGVPSNTIGTCPEGIRYGYYGSMYASNWQNADRQRPRLEYIPVANIIASSLLAAIGHRITPPISGEGLEKVMRSISTCIFRLIQGSMPDYHYHDTTGIKSLGSCFREVLYAAYELSYISTDLYCLLATRVNFIAKQCYNHLYVLHPIAKQVRECVSCGRSEPPPQLL